jgi:hypothetical protein
VTSDEQASTRPSSRRAASRASGEQSERLRAAASGEQNARLRAVSGQSVRRAERTARVGLEGEPPPNAQISDGIRGSESGFRVWDSWAGWGSGVSCWLENMHMNRILLLRLLVGLLLVIAGCCFVSQRWRQSFVLSTARLSLKFFSYITFSCHVIRFHPLLFYLPQRFLLFSPPISHYHHKLSFHILLFIYY